MRKSATDVMHEALTAAVVDAVTALKAASNGLPNALLRDLNAVHSNTAAADLPPALRDAIAKSVRLTFTQLKKDGYVVVDAKEVRRPSPVQGGSAPRQSSNNAPSRPTRRSVKPPR